MLSTSTWAPAAQATATTQDGVVPFARVSLAALIGERSPTLVGGAELGLSFRSGLVPQWFGLNSIDFLGVQGGLELQGRLSDKGVSPAGVVPFVTVTVGWIPQVNIEIAPGFSLIRTFGPMEIGFRLERHGEQIAARPWLSSDIGLLVFDLDTFFPSTAHKN